MIKIADAAMTAHLDQRYNDARRITTFIMRLDSVQEQLKAYREAEMYYRQVGRADKNLLDMPVLLLNPDESKYNRVMVKSPSGRWIDISEATPSEVADIAMGLLIQPESKLSAGDEVFANAVGGLLGLALIATVESITRPSRRESLDRRPRW